MVAAAAAGSSVGFGSVWSIFRFFLQFWLNHNNIRRTFAYMTGKGAIDENYVNCP